MLYALVPTIGCRGNVLLFCGVLCVIITMYGGGIAAIPAHLADLFGTSRVNAIHGRLPTAWSVAGILGPAIMNTLNDRQVRSGVPRADAYYEPMLLLAGCLVVGIICSLLVRPPVADRHNGDASTP